MKKALDHNRKSNVSLKNNNEISVTPESEMLRSLVGSARTEQFSLEELEEERLKYLLAK